MCTACGTAEVLSIKFDAKKDAEITQVDAVARARRSVPLMNFLVVLLAEDVFVDVSPAIIVSNAGACLLFDGFNHWCPSMVSGLLPHAIYRLGRAAFVSANKCLACLAGVHSLISSLVQCAGCRCLDRRPVSRTSLPNADLRSVPGSMSLRPSSGVPLFRTPSATRINLAKVYIEVIGAPNPLPHCAFPPGCV